MITMCHLGAGRVSVTRLASRWVARNSGESTRALGAPLGGSRRGARSLIDSTPWGATTRACSLKILSDCEYLGVDIIYTIKPRKFHLFGSING